MVTGDLSTFHLPKVPLQNPQRLCRIIEGTLRGGHKLIEVSSAGSSMAKFIDGPLKGETNDQVTGRFIIVPNGEHFEIYKQVDSVFYKHFGSFETRDEAQKALAQRKNRPF